MFADGLLETSWAKRLRRSWTILTSFGLQVVVIGLLLLLPLLRRVGLPSARTVSTPISAGRADPGPAPPVRAGGRPAVTPAVSEAPRIVAPGRMQDMIARMGDEPTPSGYSGDGIERPAGSGSGLPNSLFGTRPVVMPTPPPPTLHIFRQSTILEGSLIRRVIPMYPPLARSAGVQGPVVLFAVISKAGTIDNLRVVSGHPMLVPAAIEAVRQWRYRPYILNGQPIEVETQITVNFTLSGK